ncbi:MAG: FtsQ-type POTRA domain-containing protein [Leifsonia sp.]
MKRPQGFEAPPPRRQADPEPGSDRRSRDSVAPVLLIDRPPAHDGDEPRERSSSARVRSAARLRKRFERAEVRRFTVASRRRRRNWLIAGGAVAALIAIVVGVGFSPIMALRVVQVDGASRVPSTDIVAALGDQLGTPLALIDMDTVHERLSAFTLIQSYSTESHPPDTLVVRIIERDPIGAVKTAAGYDLVDSAGVVIASSADRPAGFPALTTPSPTALAAAGEVVRSLPADVRAQLDTVTAETRDDVTLQLATGTRVVWGSSDDSALKAVVFARLLAAAPGASLYDVSSPSSPVYSQP